MDIIDWAVVLIGVTYLIIAIFKDHRSLKMGALPLAKPRPGN